MRCGPQRQPPKKAVVSCMDSPAIEPTILSRQLFQTARSRERPRSKSRRRVHPERVVRLELLVPMPRAHDLHPREDRGQSSTENGSTLAPSQHGRARFPPERGRRVGSRSYDSPSYSPAIRCSSKYLQPLLVGHVGETGGPGQIVGSARDKSMTLGVSTDAECITAGAVALSDFAAAKFTEAVSARLVSNNRRCFMAASSRGVPLVA